MGRVCLQLMNSLELIKLGFGSGETKCCRLLHETELSVDVSQLVSIAEGMPGFSLSGICARRTGS